jgi:hypothetical protein
VLFQTYHEINYQANTKAAPNQLWEYENEGGFLRNGLNYYANYVVAYQLPLSPALSLIGFMAEMKLKLWDQLDYDEVKRKNSGYDLSEWQFSALYNAGITKRLSATLILQLATELNYTEWTRDRYYLGRELDEETPVRLSFYRAAAIITWKLH